MAETLTRYRTVRQAIDEAAAVDQRRQNHQRFLVLKASVLVLVRRNESGLTVADLVRALGVDYVAAVTAAKALQRARLVTMTKTAGRLLIRARGDS